MQKNQPRVAVVCGGPSPEAEVSRSSGAEVAKGLRERYQDVALLELEPSLVTALAAFDVVFPALHGPPGEDGTFQGFLEILGKPYVGSGVHASACAMDKIVAKTLFRARRLPVARDVVALRSAPLDASVETIVRELGERVVIKPGAQGSALGVSKVTRKDDILPALEGAFAYDAYALVEELVQGREITVGVLERVSPMALPVCEILTPNGAFYDYQHRYTPGLSEHVIPPALPEPRLREIERLAVEAHVALGCRDLSRVDFVVPDEGPPVVLEVNTLPGLTPTSLYPDEARAAGIDFADLVAQLIERAYRR